MIALESGRRSFTPPGEVAGGNARAERLRPVRSLNRGQSAAPWFDGLFSRRAQANVSCALAPYASGKLTRSSEALVGSSRMLALPA